MKIHLKIIFRLAVLIPAILLSKPVEASRRNSNVYTIQRPFDENNNEVEQMNTIDPFPTTRMTPTTSHCNPPTFTHLKGILRKLCKSTKFQTVAESKAACKAINALCRPTMEPNAMLDCETKHCPVSSSFQCTDRVGEGYGTCPLSDGGSGFCHIGCNSCLECVFEFDCFGRNTSATTGQLCQTSTNTCVGCTEDAQCQSSGNYRQLGLLYCVQDGDNGRVCAECRTSEDCLIGLECLPESHTCGLRSR